MGNTVKAESRIKLIPIYRINGSFSGLTREYSRAELIELSKSIERNGILQPLIVRDMTGHEYELVSGERRLRAAVMAGLLSVPCIILHCTKRQSAVYSLVENIQRQSRGYFEIAESIGILVNDLGFSEEKAAQQLGISESNVSEYLRLLNYTSREKRLIERERISINTALNVIKISDLSIRKRILTKIVKEELSDSEAEQLVERTLFPEIQKPVHKLIVKDVRLFCNTIEHAVETMRISGVNAEIDKLDNGSSIEYRITIAKN